MSQTPRWNRWWAAPMSEGYMRSGSRLVWLGLTPEPERELPVAVAALRAHRADPAATDIDLRPWIDAEARRIDSLIMHGTQRSWLRYLSEVTALVTTADTENPTTVLHAAETVLEHHRMLIGLPGSAYERVTRDRKALARIVDRADEKRGEP
jgi:hypothetical protein